MSADTSFSDTAAADNRGCAVASVVIQGEPFANHLMLHGRLRDGRGYSCRLHTLAERGMAQDGSGGDGLVGTHTADGWWYKVRLSAEAAYLMSRGDGRHVEYRDEPCPTQYPTQRSML